MKVFSLTFKHWLHRLSYGWGRFSEIEEVNPFLLAEDQKNRNRKLILQAAQSQTASCLPCGTSPPIAALKLLCKTWLCLNCSRHNNSLFLSLFLHGYTDFQWTHTHMLTHSLREVHSQTVLTIYGHYSHLQITTTFQAYSGGTTYPSRCRGGLEPAREAGRQSPPSSRPALPQKQK